MQGCFVYVRLPETLCYPILLCGGATPFKHGVLRSAAPTAPRSNHRMARRESNIYFLLTNGEDGCIIIRVSAAHDPPKEKRKPMSNTNKATVRTVVGIGIFAALAYVVTLVIHIPVQFLTFDAKDAVITVAGFIYGPISAVLISLIVALIELVTISDTGLWGFVMNFVSSAAFAGVASLLYKLYRSAKGAIASLCTSIVTTTGVMVLLNLFVTPLYLGVPTEAVKGLLLPLLLPFNFAKACLNASVTMLLYKPIITALRRTGLVARERRGSTPQTAGEESRRALAFNRSSAVILSIALSLAAIAIVAFILLNK